ncbi:hypothetical protein NKK48_01645 [Mesorhizobium sp. C386A]|uniref:DUF7940 domain-containing protein n=1 Tax=unclassified Mesorhizobium TaxID=325217 RepID=UPI0003CF5DCC|nr:hypothetical protein [Mesorhizobium sp. LNJC386A00]ESY35397.1 hypothetical protein X748_14330 [Mesorhizobium sp. LNJC386A00]
MSKWLHPDWYKTLRYAWSVRFIALAGLFSGLEALLPYLPAFVAISPQLLGALTGICVALAFIFRTFVSQKVFRDADQ